MASTLSIAVNYTTGQTVKAYLRKWDNETSALGDWWNNTSAAWVGADPGSSAYISLTEVASTGTYLYGRSTAMSIGSPYTGKAIIFFYVGSSVLTVSQEIYMVNGARVEEQKAASDTLADTNELQTDWVNGGRLDTLLDLATTGGVAADPISPCFINPSRTWSLVGHADAATARNVVTVPAGTIATFAMDFGGILNSQTSVSTAGSATDTDGSPVITFTDVAVSQDRKQVHMTIDDAADVTAGTIHTIKVGCVSTDSQTLYGYGILKVV